MTAPGQAPLPSPLPTGLTDFELDGIRARLGREPNELELAMFSVTWTERCSRKSSKSLLKTLPTAGPGVVAVPGEDAGVVPIGDGLAVAFRLAPGVDSGVADPDPGALPRVGGILRNLVSMGARPIAMLDALAFGDPDQPRTRDLLRGVVQGVISYANRAGVRMIGGELNFHPSYGGRPLVNVMGVGLLEERFLTPTAAPTAGDVVVLFGSTTEGGGIGRAEVGAQHGDPLGAPVGAKVGAAVGDPFDSKPLI
ncbi:MAG TPA: AIR synthase related protein, partial [Candidatus Acidoferrales bacterium]|nr:AIR synthase related protein [Candidatus Acidoferrales bacterium]